MSLSKPKAKGSALANAFDAEELEEEIELRQDPLEETLEEMDNQDLALALEEFSEHQVEALEADRFTVDGEEVSKDYVQKLVQEYLAKKLREVVHAELRQQLPTLALGESLYSHVELGVTKIHAAEYKGRKVTLNKPMQGDTKKYKVYVKNDKGNVVKVNFGDKQMEIKRDDPERRRSFRARHKCDKPGPKWKARYWSCKFWSSTPISKLLKK